MDVSELVVEVRDATLKRVGQLSAEDLVGFTAVPRANDVGSWEAHLPQTILDPVTGQEVDYELTRLLRTEGAGIIVTGPQGVILSGPMTEAKFEATADEPDGLWTITGVSDTVVLQDALAYPDPANADATTQKKDNDSRNGAAETILYAYVSANIGPTAPSSRRWADLSFPADQGRGPVVYASPRFDNLLTLLQGLATVGGLAFDVVQVGSGRTFRVWQPADRSALVQMDVVNEQLSTVDHGYGAPTATRVIVAGPGDNVLDRTFVSRTTAESLRTETKWGRRIEGFVADTSTDDTVVLAQEGDQALAENGTTVHSTAITPTEDLSSTFMVDWNVGDTVAVVIGRTPASAPVTSAILKVSDAAVLLGVTLGDPIGFDPEGVAYALATSTEQRVSSLERSGSGASAVAAVDLSPYLQKTDAAKTYATTSSLSSYATTSSLSSGLAGKTTQAYVNPGGGGSARYVRLASIDGTGASSGAHVELLLTGLGDYGSLTRGNVLVSMAQRGDNGVKVRAFGFGAEGMSGFTLYTRQLSTYVFELWLLSANWTHTHGVTLLSQQGASFVGMDSSTGTAPSGLSGSAIEWQGDFTSFSSRLGGLEGTVNGGRLGGANLGAGGDWNSYKTTGFYRGDSLANGPYASWFYVMVQNHDYGNYVSQLAHGYFDNRLFRRVCNNGTWSAWAELASSSTGDVGWTNLSYASGFSLGTGEQLRYRVLNGVVYFTGGATGTFVTGTYHSVNSSLIPTNLRPSVAVRGGAMGSGMRSAGWEINPDGTVKLGWSVVGMASGTTGPSWIALNASYPVGT